MIALLDALIDLRQAYERQEPIFDGSELQAGEPRLVKVKQPLEELAHVLLRKLAALVANVLERVAEPVQRSLGPAHIVRVDPISIRGAPRGSSTSACVSKHALTNSAGFLFWGLLCAIRRLPPVVELRCPARRASDLFASASPKSSIMLWCSASARANE